MSAPSQTRSTLGKVITYTWTPEEGLRTPQPGDLYVTSTGVGYLIARVRRSLGPAGYGNLQRVTVVTVDPDLEDFAGMERYRWTWRSPYDLRKGALA